MNADDCQYLAKDYPLAWADLTRHLPTFAQQPPAQKASLLVRYFDHHHIYLLTPLRPADLRWGASVSMASPQPEGQPTVLRLLYNELASFDTRTAQATLTVAWAGFRQREKQLQAHALEPSA